MRSGLVSNIQKYSLHDGPGIRTTVFLKGCPLRCAWCHNPESISPRPVVMVMKERCVRCGECRRVCPQLKALARATAREAGASFASVGGCVVCGACVEVCPTGARVLVGRALTAGELLKELLTDRIFYDESEGGVTFSGGEPLQQHEFLLAVLELCRAHGLRTAVDTCGFAPQEHLLTVAAQADLVLYDLKIMDADRHQEFCGLSNRLILDNLRALSEVHDNLWIRVPVLPGINDSAEEMEALVAFVAPLRGVRQVNLLPYHRLGQHKLDWLNQDDRASQLQPPTQDWMQAAAQRFAAFGLCVKTGG